MILLLASGLRAAANPSDASTPRPVTPPPLPTGETPCRSVLSGGQTASIWISILVHVVLLFFLTSFVWVAPGVKKMVLMLPPPSDNAAMDKELEELIDFEISEIELDPIEEIEDVVQIENLLESIEPVQLDVPLETPSTVALVSPMDASKLIPDASELVRLPESTGANGNDGEDAGAAGGNATVGADIRSELAQRAARRIQFSTPEMQYAINKGLIWLARHQLADGGWSFDHRIGECRGRCPHPGSKRGARVAATGFALLPFLGAGNSPEHGEYRQTVSAGIKFLIANTAENGSLWRSEGRMYGHGIATLALCECYGIMTQAPPSKAEHADERYVGYQEPTNGQQNELARQWPAVDVEQLKLAASAAADFIVSAQAIDGGWRYRPGEPGDTSVVGWQIMALKSAHDAGLGMDQRSIAAARGFLDSVQLDPVGGDSSRVIGTRYAYKPDKRKITPATTAIGLACRICMGTSPFHPAVEVGVKRIVDRGQLDGNMYYNFYANQVMFQHGGAEWDWWSPRLQQALIESQSRRGHLEGSWHFGNADHGGTAGGRLYATTMACLCLEETFRHLPAFRMNAERRFAERFGAAEPNSPDDEEAIVEAKQLDAFDFSGVDMEVANAGN